MKLNSSGSAASAPLSCLFQLNWRMRLSGLWPEALYRAPFHSRKDNFSSIAAACSFSWRMKEKTSELEWFIEWEEESNEWRRWVWWSGNLITNNAQPTMKLWSGAAANNSFHSPLLSSKRKINFLSSFSNQWIQWID